MNKNYKLQITNKAAPFGQVLNAFGEGDAHELHELTRITERNYNGKITTKGSHGLHQDTFKLQTMTALIKSFCGGGMRKAQSAGRKANKMISAVRKALCAMLLPPGR
jgi:hypothetical protein